MSTGVKNLDGVIGIDPAGNALRHAFQRAEEVGKSTGVITNVQWSHATPAGFVAHNSSRNNYDQIAREMIYDSATDVIMGAGHPFYNDNGERLSTPPFQYKYVGGEATWNDLVAGTAGDPDWTHIQTRQEFRRLMWGRAPKRVCGTAQVASTTQQSRRNNPGDPDNRDDAPYEVPLNETVPTLAEMTLGALNVLDCDNDGLCLMIEGGAVDWTGHANQKGRLIEEEIDFNHAVEAVMLWVLCHSNWDETLLIVTGDHETGYLWGRGSNPTWEPIVNNGRGVPPGMQFNSGDHTNQLIPIFAKGDASRLLAAKADQVDPERGRYIDNTEIAEVMFDVID